MNRQKNGFNGNPINSGSQQQTISIKQLKLKIEVFYKWIKTTVRVCMMTQDSDRTERLLEGRMVPKPSEMI